MNAYYWYSNDWKFATSVNTPENDPSAPCALPTSLPPHQSAFAGISMIIQPSVEGEVTCVELFEIYLADSVTLKLTNSTLSSLLGSFELTLTLPDIIHKIYPKEKCPLDVDTILAQN